MITLAYLREFRNRLVQFAIVVQDYGKNSTFRLHLSHTIKHENISKGPERKS